MYTFAIAVLGLNVILGYAGEIVLAQEAFMAISAYTTVNLLDAGTRMLPALIISGPSSRSLASCSASSRSE